MTDYEIRRLGPDDAPSIARLDRLSPEEGHLILSPKIEGDLAPFLWRYPRARGYGAFAGSEALVGVTFASRQRVMLQGESVPGVYVYFVRVHPAFRRRGIASRLIGEAVEAARDQVRARLAWAGVVAGNRPSARLFQGLGFAAVGSVSLRPGLPAGADLGLRPARRGDLEELRQLLRSRYAGHRFFPDLDDPESLAAASDQAFFWVLEDGHGIGAAVQASYLWPPYAFRVAGSRWLPRRLRRWPQRLPLPRLRPIVLSFPVSRSGRDEDERRLLRGAGRASRDRGNLVLHPDHWGGRVDLYARGLGREPHGEGPCAPPVALALPRPSPPDGPGT